MTDNEKPQEPTLTAATLIEETGKRLTKAGLPPIVPAKNQGMVSVTVRPQRFFQRASQLMNSANSSEKQQSALDNILKNKDQWEKVSLKENPEQWKALASKTLSDLGYSEEEINNMLT